MILTFQGSPVHLRSKSDTTTPIISPYKSNISLFGQPPHLSIINNRPPISRPKSQYDLPNSSHPPTHVGSSHHMLDTSPYKNYVSPHCREMDNCINITTGKHHYPPRDIHIFFSMLILSSLLPLLDIIFSAKFY